MKEGWTFNHRLDILRTLDGQSHTLLECAVAIKEQQPKGTGGAGGVENDGTVMGGY